MKVYVAKNGLGDYTDGLVVIKAKNLKESIRIINESEINFSGKDEIIISLRELKDNELVYVCGWLGVIKNENNGKHNKI